MRYKRLQMSLLAFCCLVFAAFASAEVPQHSIRMYNEEAFSVEQEKFYPSDTIYVVVDFTDIKAGVYNLNIDWILPTGKLVKQDSHTLTVSEDSPAYRIYFWLQLHEKGAIEQMFTGGEYSKAVYGRWRAQVYSNGEPLTQVGFEVTDSVI